MAAKRSFIELTYYETYYFSNVVKNVLENQFEYIRQLDDFYGDGRHLNYAHPFPKFSAFHSFIRFIIGDVLSEDVQNIKLDILQDDAARLSSMPSRPLDLHPSKLPVNLALDRFGIVHEPFEKWLSSRGNSFLDATDGDVEEYYDDLCARGQVPALLDRTAAEVFFVLFQNRSSLLRFNEMMARQMGQDCRENVANATLGHLFSRRGVLRRVSIPSWARRAVFFRDRGLCVICASDLSGVLAIGSEENYDHIVPLASGGLNDVTNIQLLCRRCNAKKLAGDAATTSRYEAWYPDHE